MMDCPAPLASLQEAFALGMVAGAAMLFWFGFYIGLTRRARREAMD